MMGHFKAPNDMFTRIYIPWDLLYLYTHTCIFLFFFFLAMPCGLQDLSSWPSFEPMPSAMNAQSLTTGPPGNSQELMYLISACSVAQSCPTLMDCSPPGSSAHRTFQARILEWVVTFSSRGSSQPEDRTCISCIGRWILYLCTIWEAYLMNTVSLISATNVEIIFNCWHYSGGNLKIFLIMIFTAEYYSYKNRNGKMVSFF